MAVGDCAQEPRLQSPRVDRPLQLWHPAVMPLLFQTVTSVKVV